MSTELHFAAQKGDLATAQNLIARGADVNIRDENGNTPLKYASAEPHPEMLRLLLNHGAQPNLADHRGFTPLHCVAGHGFYDEALDMADILISAGANLNPRSTQYGFGLLHEVRTIPMINFLIGHGADPTVRDDQGLLPHENLREECEDEEADHLQQIYRQRVTE